MLIVAPANVTANVAANADIILTCRSGWHYFYLLTSFCLSSVDEEVAGWLAGFAWRVIIIGHHRCKKVLCECIQCTAAAIFCCCSFANLSATAEVDFCFKEGLETCSFAFACCCCFFSVWCQFQAVKVQIVCVCAHRGDGDGNGDGGHCAIWDQFGNGSLIDHRPI